MKFETQFRLGDNVYVLYNDRIYNVEVTGIEVFITLKEQGINYKVRFPAGGEAKFAETRLFFTKLIGEVDPTDDGKFRVFHRLNLIGIHLEEHWAISHLQKAIAAGITGTVKFALA